MSPGIKLQGGRGSMSHAKQGWGHMGEDAGREGCGLVQFWQ